MYVGRKIHTTITTVSSCVATAFMDAAAKGGIPEQQISWVK
jgi:hypothetical protein